MPWRLHREGRFRAWLGERFGGGPELGDRIWRRCLHFAGASVLLYYLLPPRFFLLLSTEEVLLLALGGVLVMEGMRLAAGLELPTIRPWETRRIASYAYYAVALVLAVLLFPTPIAVFVVLGTAFVDPLIGELRRRPVLPAGTIWWLPILVYLGVGVGALSGVGHWGLLPAALAALVGGLVAVAVERPKLRGYDDDLAMTLVPGVILTLWLFVWPAYPGLG